MSRTWVRFAVLPLLLCPVPGKPQQPATATTLKSSSSTLQLPGSLNLTATVAPAANAPGMPSGSVQFFNNTTSSIGTAPLTAIPSTENFSAPENSATLGSLPFGVFSVPLPNSKYSVFGVLDYSVTTGVAVFYTPRLTIYSGQGANLFATSAAYLLGNSDIGNPNQGVDATAIGDFNKDGIPDVVIHGFNSTATENEYYVLFGKSDGTYDPTTSVLSVDNSGITCGECSNPTIVMTVDDFNGDGYSDVAYAGSGPGTSGQIGVALNAGSTSPGSLTTFKTAPAVTVGSLSGFEPTSISSGHLTSSGHADLIVGGSFGQSPGYIAVFLGNGDGTFANPATTATAGIPAAVATADFRGSGTTDVVVVNNSVPTVNGDVQVFFGNGAGSLVNSSTVTFCANPALVGAVEAPASVAIKDFNNDGFLDILATGTFGSLCLLLNDGTGHFSTASLIGTAPGSRAFSAVGDFNGDGLADIAELTAAPTSDSATLSSAYELLNSASSQAVFTTPAQSLPSGTDMLTATFPSDANLAASTSSAVAVTVTQTTPLITWPPPAAIEFGTALGSAQLDATASVAGVFSYAPSTGVVLVPGSHTVTAAFVPTDTFDYSGAQALQTITVTAPTLSGITPSSASLGSGNTTITLSGQGFVTGAQVLWNGTALATNLVSLNQLTAVVPASLLATPGSATITVTDPNGVAVAGSQTFTINAVAAVAQASAEASVEAGRNATLTLTVSPYPAPITATLTMSFTPNPPDTVVDPTVLFANNTTSDTIQVPANSTAPIPAIDFATGSTAGTITITIKLSASGADVTPATLTPVLVTVPPAPPVISSVTLTRDGDTLTVAILGLSSTREMTQAEFHFTPAQGQTLSTTDLTVSVSTPFSTWYGSTSSDQYGTTFLYTQPFTLSSDATNVGSVSVTLSNSQGASASSSAQ